MQSHRQQELILTPYRRYDEQNDRLFIVYYSLPSVFNSSGWRVTDSSIPRNIHTALNKPVVMYRKDPNNPFHARQAGTFIHPTPEEAISQLGKIDAEKYYEWQEQFAVGRVRRIDKREGKGYAFTIEITDPLAKQILMSDDYKNGIPGWTSPQILYNSRLYPNEHDSGVHEHWTISHIALVDAPAYGYAQAGVRAKCFGTEKECMIETRNASQQENLGFCVKQATIDLLQSRLKHDAAERLRTVSDNILHSSHVLTEQNLDSNNMSYNTAQPSTKNEVVNVTKSLSEQNPKNDSSDVASTTPEPIAEQERNTVENESEEKIAIPKSMDEAVSIIKELQKQNASKDELLRSNQKEMKDILKWKDKIEHERRVYKIKSIIPRDLFKSEDSHDKEVTRIIEKGLDSDLEFLKGHYELMRQAKRAGEEMNLNKPQMVAAKSASHEVPDYTNSDVVNSSSQNRKSIVDKQLELQRMIIDGGVA